MIDLIVRVINAIFKAINIKRKKDAVNNPADTIVSGGSVQQSDESFADISDRAKRDKP